jgi:hypothetical protein
MSSAVHKSVQAIVDQVRDWPADDRLALVDRLLGTLNSSHGPWRRPGLASLLGRLRIDQAAPSDEECRQILEGERIRKHGP